MDRLVFRNIFSRATTSGKPGNTGTPAQPASIPNKPVATILIVDDSKTQVQILQTLLKLEGYATLAACNGQEGIGLAKTHRPDLILMDVVMPVVNGFQATRALRKNPITKDIPVIIISGTEQASDKVWGLRVGANDFMAKPVKKAVLMGKIEKLLKSQSNAQGHEKAIVETADTHLTQNYE